MTGAPPRAAINDFTDFFLGAVSSASPQSLMEQRVNQLSDLQCAHSWPAGSDDDSDSTSCSTQPQIAGHCYSCSTMTLIGTSLSDLRHSDQRGLHWHQPLQPLAAWSTDATATTTASRAPPARSLLHGRRIPQRAVNISQHLRERSHATIASAGNCRRSDTTGQ